MGGIVTTAGPQTPGMRLWGHEGWWHVQEEVATVVPMPTLAL